MSSLTTAFGLAGEMPEREKRWSCFLSLARCQGERLHVRTKINRFPGKQWLGTQGKNGRAGRSGVSIFNTEKRGTNL